MLFQTIHEDWVLNRGNPKIRLVLLFYRFAHQLASQKKRCRLIWVASIPILVLYRIVVEWILCIELPAKTIIGPGLQVHHGQSLVVNGQTVIGRNCVLRHCTTIGNVILPDGQEGPSPVINDNVEIGANVVIIGGINIGNDAIIGAGSIVTKDVPPYAIVVGNPGRVIRFKNHPADAAGQ
jgi:putative colanic acid biosynthesis acetyltransferase WcaB